MIINVVPISPVPVIGLFSVIVFIIGASGAVVSSAVTCAGTDALPAGSVTTTCNVSPFFCAGFTATSKLPFASAVPVPITLPLASFTSTFEPGSALPVTLLPSSLTSKLVAVDGAVVSSAVTGAGADALPAASVAVTCNVSPFFCAGFNATSKLPFASAVPEPITLPPASFTSTLEPGSALPVTLLPSSLTSKSVGAAGAVVSSAVTGAGTDALPAASVAVTCSVSPFFCAGLTATSKSPFASAVPEPITLPLASFTSTLEPGSALPVTLLPSSLTSKSVGAAGAVVSSAVTGAGADALPAASVAVTCSVSPFFCAGFNATSKSPFASAVPEPITLPPASFTSTLEPGSALPVTLLPSSLTSKSVGAAGAKVSKPPVT
ncbi:hypothetical protein [Acinetobacter sp. CWB-B33]|uniref:hypothetical protein n=1 Tax=Acinetobacter sp. CWB-B33 TaxID=2815724 RepID=UPI0031FEC725